MRDGQRLTDFFGQVGNRADGNRYLEECFGDFLNAADAESSPAKVVDRTLRYLQNQQDKMRYDEYRQRGLPVTSSHIESVVKQIHQRVKGTEKFWSEDGSEAMLQLRADYLNDGEPLQDFCQRRQATATGQRRHRRAG